MTALRRLSLSIMLVFLAAMPLAAQEKKPATIKAGKEQLDFLIGDELVTRYHVDPKSSKPNFWPVHSPNGASLTRSYPLAKGIPGESTDHIHHRSIWFCHGDVIPEGIDVKSKIKGVEGVDFWSEAKGHGNIVCTKIEEPRNTKGSAQVATHNDWRMADGTKIMDETRVIHFYDFGKARLLVLDIDLEASVCPITFGDTKEGSMGIRINDQIRDDKGKSFKDTRGTSIKVPGQGRLQNAEGKLGEKECWGHRSAWCDYSGPIDGKVAGLAILADPKNLYPSCFHARGYGLNAANPFGRGASGFPDVRGNKDLVRLAKGEHLKLRFGLVLHDGDAVAGGVADAYQRFVDLRGKE